MNWKRLKNNLLTLFRIKVEHKKYKHLVITAPSGAGKTTIVRHLLQKFDFLSFSVSATNRAERPHEQHGKDYYFLSTEAFKSKIENNELVEWEEVYQNQYYGTLFSEIKRIEDLNKHIVFDIDVKGAISIKEAYGENVLTLFIKPPTFETLKQRLINRKTESKSSLEKRLKRVEIELKFESKFDKVLVNDDLELAFKEAEQIVEKYIKPI